MSSFLSLLFVKFEEKKSISINYIF